MAIRSSSELATLSLAAPEFIWETDKHVRFVFVSSRVEEILGVPPERVIGRTPFDFMPPDDAARVSELLARDIFPFKKPFQNLVHRSIKPDGSVVWQRIAGSPVYGADGSLIGYRGTAYDFTRQKAIEEELRRQLEIFRQTEKFAKIGGWEVDVADRRVYWSEEIFQIHEVDGPQPTIEEAIEFYRPEARTIINNAVEEAIRSGASYDLELPLTTAKGREIWVRTVGAAIREGGVVVKVAGAFQDITEQRRAKQLIEQTNQKLEAQALELERAKQKAESGSEAKSRFLANMSHEVRTPLTGVLGMLDLLFDTNPSVEQIDLLTTARGAAKSLLMILNDVLDFSKIEAGKLDLDANPFSLSDLTAELCRLYEHQCHENELSFESIVAEAVPEFVVGDQYRLRQVLRNLLANAVKFTPSGGSVRFSVAAHREGENDCLLSFSVSDTGIGIPKEQHGAVFEAFSQADTSITRRFGGTGLGLAISSELISLMGGKLELSSESGRGTTVFVSVRMPLAEGVEVAEPANESSLHPSSPLRILLVEDNAVNQKLIVRILEKAGHTVFVAGDGREGVLLASQSSPNLILMDMQMPVMDGEEATKRLRELGITVPIIALTAHALTGDRERFLKLGVDEYVPKPIDRTLLLQTLNRVSELRGVPRWSGKKAEGEH